MTGICAQRTAGVDVKREARLVARRGGEDRLVATATAVLLRKSPRAWRLRGSRTRRDEPLSGLVPPKPQRISGPSDLELDADLHDLRAREIEIGVGTLGVAVHEGEDRLAPAREARPLA